MHGMKPKTAFVAVTLALFVLHAPVRTQAPQNEHWVTTWATAVVPRASQPPAAPAPAGQGQGAPQAAPAVPRFANQTLRQIVHTSLGGDRIRVVLSNTFGTAPLNIGAAGVARRDRESSLVPGSTRTLTFSSRASVSIAPGAVVVSDPVALTMPSQSDLAIDIYLPDDTGSTASPLTVHAGALQTNYLSAAGNHAGSAMLPVLSANTSWYFLARVEVGAAADAGTVVALGDSITDGTRSTPDTNNRWPDHLSRALAERSLRVGVANMGIGGNRLLADNNGPSAPARFDRDVLAPAGVTHLIVMEGINDLGRAAPAADVIAAQKQVLERAHAHRLTVIGATITPVEDTTQQGYYTPANEAARQEVNQWIRTGRAYDAVVDFDMLLRDPIRPTKLHLPLASPDFIHPNEAGYREMGRAIDPALFSARAAATATAAR